MKTRLISLKYLIIVPLLLTALSCRTVPVQEAAAVPVYVERPDEAEGAYMSIMAAVEDARNADLGERDIDNREWLMGRINAWADADQLMISLIYEALYYRGWKEDTRREFLGLMTGASMPDDEAGAVNAQRAVSLGELDYLLTQSLLLRDSPWMVRDFFDEKAEFSYWYLLYLGRSFDTGWLKETVLPVMRSLIREDRITAASYIWLNKPGSLGSMESEIRQAGYPWNRLVHLLAMADHIRSEMERLFPEGSPDPRVKGMLF